MSTKSHWRQPALMMAALLGIASGACMNGNAPVTPFGFARRRSRGGGPGHYLRRVTIAMLSGAKWSGDPAPRSLVRPWRSTDGMTGKAYRRQQKRQRRAARAWQWVTR